MLAQISICLQTNKLGSLAQPHHLPGVNGCLQKLGKYCHGLQGLRGEPWPPGIRHSTFCPVAPLGPVQEAWQRAEVARWMCGPWGGQEVKYGFMGVDSQAEIPKAATRDRDWLPVPSHYCHPQLRGLENACRACYIVPS